MFFFRVKNERQVISFLSKPTRCTKVSNLFYFGMTLYMFRTVFLSVIRISRLYTQEKAFVKQILLLLASKQTAISVCTVLNS